MCDFVFASQDGKLSYAQIAQRKKEEKEAREAAEKAKAAAAAAAASSSGAGANSDGGSSLPVSATTEKKAGKDISTKASHHGNGIYLLPDLRDWCTILKYLNDDTSPHFPEIDELFCFFP